MEVYVNTLYDKLVQSIGKYHPKYDKVLIKRAFFYAYQAHQSMKRKSGEPFIVHPLQVALHLTTLEADDVSVSAALLHDVLDNPKYHIEDIIGEFGEEIGNIVAGVTALGNLYYTVDMDQPDIENLKKSLVLAGNDIRIFLVKIADRYHNLETLKYLPKSKRYRIARETEEIYLPIVNFLSIGQFLSSMYDMCFEYSHQEEYQNLSNLFGKKYDAFKQKIIQTHQRVTQQFQKEGLNIITMEGRVKSLYSIYRKIKFRHIHLSDIYDVLALRIITKKKKDAYHALGIIHSLYKVKSDRFKDYISDPKENGYQSIHTTVYDEVGEFLEFQIETQQMAKMNKTGMAAHFLYKGFGVEYKNFPQWMKSFLDTQKKSFDSSLFIEKLTQEVFSDMRCYDVDNREVILPKNSVLIDFAFEKGNEYGNYFFGAYINGRWTQNPFYVLKNGDHIQLEISSEIYFQYKIENYFLLQTQVAKNGVKNIFEKYSKEKLVELGTYMMNTALETYSYRHFHAYSQKIKQQIVEFFGVKDENQLALFVAIGSINVENIVKKIILLCDKKTFDKKITLKIQLKTKDINTLDFITKIFENLDLKISLLSYRSNKNLILLTFEVDTYLTLEEVLAEIKRAPNTYKITRLFPGRLTWYYILYFGALTMISTILFCVHYFDFSKNEKNIIVQLILFLSSIFMVGIVFLIKYLVKTILPDLLRYKRFWLSLFLLNTYVFFILFWETFSVGVNMFFLFYFLLIFIIYILIIIEYFSYRKYKN